MERVDNGDGKILWRKVGGSPFIFNGRHIKPGQTFRAAPSEIPKAFRDLIIPMETLVEVEGVESVKPVVFAKSSYTVKPRGRSGSWFDVVREDGKVINEKALRKEVADQLIKDMEK